MVKRITVGFEAYRILAAFAFLSCIAAVNLCAQRPAQPRAQAELETPQAKPPATMKISLNAMAMGTIRDTSLLRQTLADVFRRREIDGPFKKGTYEIEKTVLIMAERSARISDVAIVIEDIEAAGASSVQLAIEVNRARGFQPDPHMLVVTVGDRAFDLTKVIAGGIKLLHTEFTLKRSEIYSISKEFVRVRCGRDVQRQRVCH